jgi:parvulin-like peptidyl-prolyl isomerase
MYLRWFIFLAISAAAASAADVRVVEEIVAKVNGDIITRSELDQQRVEFEKDARQEGLTGVRLQETVNQAVKDALREQIDQMLLVQRAKDMSINVDPDVTRQIAEVQARSKIADPDKFHEWVRQQTGTSYEDYRQHMKDDLLRQRVVSQEIASRISIPDADKRKYYEEHKKEFVREAQVFLRQILISTDGKTPEQVAAAEKRAAEVVARARRGDKFTDLVREFSDDTVTTPNGGALPPFKHGDLRKEIEDVVFKQDKGYVTDPIKVQNPNGLLILRIDERYEAGQASFEEVENEVTNRVSMPLLEPKLRDYLTKLRQDAFLEIRQGYEDSGAAPGKDTSWRDPAQLRPETTTKAEVAANRKRRILWMIPLSPRKDRVDSLQPAASAPAAQP